MYSLLIVIGCIAITYYSPGLALAMFMMLVIISAFLLPIWLMFIIIMAILDHEDGDDD